MNIQTIKSLDGQEFVLLPVSCYEGLKEQIDTYMAKKNKYENKDEYVPFVLEDYVKNPIALARINAGVTQKELARLLRISQAYVSKLESSRKVSARAMSRVENALKNANTRCSNPGTNSMAYITITPEIKPAKWLSQDTFSSIGNTPAIIEPK